MVDTGVGYFRALCDVFVKVRLFSELIEQEGATNLGNVQNAEIGRYLGRYSLRKIENLTQQNKAAIILLIFSALLVFFDPTASLIFQIPRQALSVLMIVYLTLVPLYLIKNRPAYIIGIIVAAFVVFFFRTRIPSPSLPIVPILQYFLAFFSLISFRQVGRTAVSGEQTPKVS